MTRRHLLGSLAAASCAAFAPAEAKKLPRSTLTGRVLRRGEPDYEDFRLGMPWQMFKPNRYPDWIVQAQTDRDIIAAVNFARRNGLRVAVKSGGHHVWANFLRDGGLLLDLSRLRSVAVQPDARRATVGPSVWGRNLIQRTLLHGLGFPVAHCATVGMGGFLLGGGFGLNGDQWGTMSCFALAGAQVVTAAGELAQVSAAQNPDLFWALRGAGNGFPGIVTQFDLNLFPAPASILSSTYIFPASATAAVAELAQHLADSRPAHTEILAIMAIAKHDTPRNQVICVLRVATVAPDPHESREILERISNQPGIAAAIARMEYVSGDWEGQFLDSIDAGRGFGFGRYAVDNLWTHDPKPLLAMLADKLADSPSGHSHAVLQFKVKTELPAGAAFSRIAPVYAGLYSVWRDPALDGTAMNWLRTSMQSLTPLADGHYINEIDAEARPASIAACFSAAAYQQLRTLRSRRDPGGVFFDFWGNA